MSRDAVDHHALLSNGHVNTAPRTQSGFPRADIKRSSVATKAQTTSLTFPPAALTSSFSVTVSENPRISTGNTKAPLDTASNVFRAPNVEIPQSVQRPAASQMITSGEMYEMAPAPLFMTHSASVYPQVALIPEADLLRSMIVQDVKQVTQKLLDKNTKKRRGRRSRKEEVIPGDFGTLKINFSKFVEKERPVFSREEPPAPKRTIYQRIAPYPVAVSEPNTGHILEKPARKTKGMSGRSLKRSEKLDTDCAGNSPTDGTKETHKRRMHRMQRSSSSGSKSNKIRDGGTGKVSGFSTEFRTSSVEVALSSSAEILGAIDLSNVADSRTTPANEVKEVLENHDMNGSDHVTGSLCLETEVGLPKPADSRFIAETTETSDSSCKQSIFDENSNHIRVSQSQNDYGSSTIYSELFDGATTAYGLGTNLGSPDVIGNELKSLLSELYSDFPPLSPANIDENMEVGTLGEELSSQMSNGVLVGSRLQISGPEGLLDVTQAISQNALANSLCGDFPVSSSSDSILTRCTSSTDSSCPTVVQCRTEVLCDSAWNDSCAGGVAVPPTLSSAVASDCIMTSRTEVADNTRGNIAEETVFSMEVDASHAQGGGCAKNLLDIVDISPEYASTEGGGKIILIGSWNNKNARYSCRFGNVSTPADLIQNGVLRCFCPTHSPGKVKVSVLRNDLVITKSVDFEYVDTEEQQEDLLEERHDWLKILDEDLKLLLVERIEAISDIFDAGNSVARFPGHLCSTVDLEDALVRVCESISKLQDLLPINIDYKSDMVMTVLHLSAALGYTKLVQTLCTWVETNSNKIMLQEADPLKFDQFQLTPLMWACAKGKFDTVCVLLQWEESAVHQTDACGCSPLSISRDQGHTILVRYLEKLQSKGSMSKTSSLASDSGSPNMRSGRLSRSSSMSSQVESCRELQPGADDSAFFESSRRSPGSNRISHDGSPESTNGSLQLSRTLGQTLVHVQAIIQDGVAAHNDHTRASPLSTLDLDDDSLFTPSPFTPSIRRLNNSADDRHGNPTPKSLVSLSPASPGQNSGCQSPFDATLRDTAEFCEFFYNSDRILEKDFAELTLTDEEQQNLYKAASVIQNAYKRYRERRKQRDTELSAAVLIQSYYRRYKQYAMFKKMQRGAVVIQHKYRAHREKEKQKTHAASVIQSYYRRYKERKNVPDMNGLSDRGTNPDLFGSSLQMIRPNTLPEWRKHKTALSQQKL